MIQVKLKDLLNDQFRTSLHVLRTHPDIKASVAWKILPVSKKIKETLDNHEKIRLSLCEKYGDKDENGNAVMIALDEHSQIKRYAFSPEGLAELNSEMAQLVELPVELPDLAVSVSNLGGIKFSVEDLSNLVGIVLLGE